MIRNDFTNETAHVANWLLYSGCVDPTELFDMARREAEMESQNSGYYEDDEYSPEDDIQEILAAFIEDAFISVIVETLPSAWGVELDECRMIGIREASYREMSPESFALSLLAPALEKICFWRVAGIVAEHVEHQREQPTLQLHTLN